MPCDRITGPARDIRRAGTIGAMCLATMMNPLSVSGADLMTRPAADRFPAAAWYAAGHRDGLVLAPDDAVALPDRVLLENDSPGAGRLLPKESGNAPGLVKNDCWIRKRFFIAGPAPAWCRLVLDVRAAPDAPLRVLCNGQPFEWLPPAAATSGRPRYRYHAPEAGRWYGWATGRTGSRSGWFYADLPPAALTAGWNTIVLQGVGTQAWQIGRADYAQFWKGSDTPRAPFPWTSDLLANDPAGAWTPIAGEWGIRLALGRHPARGALESPVVDLDEPAGLPGVQAPVSHRAAALDVEADLPPGAALDLERRDGDTPFLRPDTWTVWRPDAPGVRTAARRYAQWRVTLRSEDGQAGPRVAAFRLTVEREPAAPDWTAGVRVTHWQAPDFVPAPSGYRYEEYRHPALQKLRREARLDERVSGLTHDFEIMRALLRWAYRVPLRAFTADDWPFEDISWNALDYVALEPAADGALRENTYPSRRRDGFCMVPNLALMQALLAFGIPARYTTLDGHEICEAWSNERGKWILLDATRECYYADRETGVPLNALEALRLAREAPARLALEGAPNPHPLDPAHPETISREMEGFRILPRTNFLAQRYPLPINPGYLIPWPWNGYLNWEDPARPVYHAARVSGRAQDFYWTLNGVRLALEGGAAPGAVTVWLNTDTPGLARFLAQVDGGDWQSVPDGWIWALHPGENRLRVRSENAMGRRGPESGATLLWTGPGAAPAP